MKLDSDKDLTRLDALIKDGQGYIINNAGKIIAVITLLISAVVTFTDVSISAFGGESFTVSLLLMLSASYIMYFSLESSGERLGERCDEFICALQKYNSVRAKITSEQIEELRAFCLDYARRDAEYRKRSALLEAGLSEDDYRAYKNGKDFSKKDRRALRKCEKIIPKRLTPALLLSETSSGGGGELIASGRSKAVSTLLGLFPTTLGTFLTVSVILTAKTELTASGIIEGIVKLSTLPLIGFKGYSSGYSYVKVARSRRLESKAEILEEFIVRSQSSEK